MLTMGTLANGAVRIVRQSPEDLDAVEYDGRASLVDVHLGRVVVELVNASRDACVGVRDDMLHYCVNQVYDLARWAEQGVLAAWIQLKWLQVAAYQSDRPWFIRYRVDDRSTYQVLIGDEHWEFYKGAWYRVYPDLVDYTGVDYTGWEQLGRPDPTLVFHWRMEDLAQARRDDEIPIGL
jgi:hypothetical protein